jgi:hypothetical protein
MPGRRYRDAYNCDSKVHHDGDAVSMYRTAGCHFSHPSLRIRGHLVSKRLRICIAVFPHDTFLRG